MKKLLLIMGLLLVAGSLSFSVEPTELGKQEANNIEEEAKEDEVVLSRRRSFLRAFGMHEKDDGGPEEESRTGSITVAHSMSHSASQSLTSIQNTPYRNK